MGENAESAGLSRRDVLKRSAIVGGLVWVAPTVLASPAGGSTAQCPPSSRFALKHNVPDRGCETVGTNPQGDGNCAANDGITEFRDGCCLEAAGLITFTQSADLKTHTYVLANGVAFSRGFGKCGNECLSDLTSVVNEFKDLPVAGKTTVTVNCSSLSQDSLSHSEIVVCYSGTDAPNCP